MRKPCLAGAMFLLSLLTMPVRGGSWSRSYGIPFSDVTGNAPVVRQAADGGFFVLTTYLSSSEVVSSQWRRVRTEMNHVRCDNFSNARGFIVMRTDPGGAVRWTQQFESGTCVSGNDLAATPDGGAVILGSIAPDPPVEYPGVTTPIAVKLDAGGNITWQKALHAPSPAFELIPRSVKSTADGGALFALASTVVKLSAAGAVELTHRFVNQLQGDVIVNDVLPASDGYVVAGTACDFSESSSCSMKALTASISDAGVVQWAKLYGNSSTFLSIQRATADSMYVETLTGHLPQALYYLRNDGTPLWAAGMGSASIPNYAPGAVDPTGRIWYGWNETDSGDALVRTFGIDGSVQDYTIGTSGEAESATVLTGTSLGVGLLGSSDLGTRLMNLDLLDSACLALAATSDATTFSFTPTAVRHAFSVADAGMTAGAFAMGRTCLASNERAECGGSTAVRRITSQAAGCSIALDFEFAAGQKVLIHKYREDDDFLSEYQTRIGSDSGSPTADGRIEVRVRVSDSGTPVADRNVFFRVFDPADTADYVRNASDHHVDDNRDPLFPRGTVEVPAASACPGLPAGSPPCVVSDPDGWARIVFKITDRYAGDNYHVQASLDPSFACGNACPQSGLITAWKRLYVERHRMFRRGAFIRRAVIPGTRQVFVSDPTQFQPGDIVELIRAPGLDQRDYAGPLAGVTPGYTFEFNEVQSVQQDPAKPGDWYLAMVNPVDDAYGPDYKFGTLEYLSDAVGVVTGDDATDYYTADDALIRAMYQTMFVDVHAVPQAITEVPLMTVTPEGYPMTFFSQRWFENSRTPMPGSAGTDLLANHRLLIGGNRTADRFDTAGVLIGALMGLSLDSYWSFVWAGRIEAAVSEQFPCPTAANPAGQCVHNVFGRSAPGVNREVAAHELTHLWLVNPTGTTGHCAAESWRGNGTFCLMHTPFNTPAHNSELDDGITDLHYGPDSEYIHIRRAAEPMPEQ